MLKVRKCKTHFLSEEALEKYKSVVKISWMLKDVFFDKNMGIAEMLRYEMKVKFVVNSSFTRGGKLRGSY